jgi:hypothetical protein
MSRTSSPPVPFLSHHKSGWWWLLRVGGKMIYHLCLKVSAA